MNTEPDQFTTDPERVVDYQAVCGRLDALSEEGKDLLDLGWEPFGSLGSAIGPDGELLYHQAFVRRGKNAPWWVDARQYEAAETTQTEAP